MTIRHLPNADSIPQSFRVAAESIEFAKSKDAPTPDVAIIVFISGDTVHTEYYGDDRKTSQLVGYLEIAKNIYLTDAERSCN